MLQGIYVWDRVVRGFHWLLVVAFATSYLTGEEESVIHPWSGYCILALLIVRLVWGLVGTRHARFSSFFCSPLAAFGHLRDMVRGQARHYTGHNPAATWMIIALFLSLGATGFTGLKVYGLEGHGPLAVTGQGVSLVARAYADDDADEEGGDGAEGEDGTEGQEGAGEEFWEEIHEFCANLTLALVLVHVGGVIASSVLERENLVRAMLTGYKRQR